jgi:hypothetical protein
MDAALSYMLLRLMMHCASIVVRSLCNARPPRADAAHDRGAKISRRHEAGRI